MNGISGERISISVVKTVRLSKTRTAVVAVEDAIAFLIVDLIKDNRPGIGSGGIVSIDTDWCVIMCQGDSR